MSLVRVIGLVGRSRVGKDTVADYIISKFPYYKRIRLSQPIKDAIRVLYGFTEQQLEGPEKEEIDRVWNITPRQAMIQMTHSMMEFMGHDFFTKRLFDNYKGTTIIIPDVRFQHDIDKIRSIGGITIKIERPDNKIQHETEQKIDAIQCDYTVVNNGSLHDMYKQIENIFEPLSQSSTG